MYWYQLIVHDTDKIKPILYYKDKSNEFTYTSFAETFNRQCLCPDFPIMIALTVS